MATIRVSTTIEAPVEQVWEYVRDISTHTEWMADAESIAFRDEQTEGLGTEFNCLTKIGPIKFTDEMVITEWIEQSSIGVRHTGLVAGEGRFTLTPAGTNRTEFCWIEDLLFPMWMGGPLRNLMGARILEWVWRRNLKTLRAKFARPSE
ncbi:MAG: SRPBCC family protein [Acidimicrobiia bacterium]|nr:SRPBCC family protein [Acidimicrobiia bacterium]MYC57183.1 SRPBCC family protein [Acidimicrobiia bacterium]MYG93890.1 SRPBCC family protein [Acidimicrobiia bacterium]MYI29893.1 SRPBCC family protein [Acidimicrobiia bacterium]